MGTDQDGANHRHSVPSQELKNDEQKKPLPKKVKYFTAGVIYYGNIAFGCALNTYGPAITTMQNKYETDDATISNAFSILTLCYMLGALAAGLTYNHVNRQLAVISIVTTMAMMVFVTPFCPTITTFFASVAILGLCSGSYDTAQFVWMMEMMQKDCPPYVQAQHFFYAVGTNLVSFIMAPFLDNSSHEMDNQLRGNGTMEQSVGKDGVIEDASKLIMPYAIVGIIVSINALAQIFLFNFMRYYPPPPEVFSEDETEPEVSHTNDSGFKIGSWSLPKLRVVLLCVSFYAAYQAMEMTTFQFFPKFGQNSDLKLSESESSYILTGMTASFAICRGIAIVAVFKLSLQLILCVSRALLVIANGLLFMWGQSSLPMLWAAGIVFGMGFSSMYGSFSAWMERSLKFTNFIASMMLVGGAGMASIYPIIIGNFIEESPGVLSYTAAASILALTVSIGVLSYLTHKNKTRY